MKVQASTAKFKLLTLKSKFSIKVYIKVQALFMASAKSKLFQKILIRKLEKAGISLDVHHF